MERSHLFMLKSALTSTIAIPALMLSFASVVEAGPNEGGVILLHRNPDVVYTSGVDYCGQSDLLSCSDAVTRADVDDTVVLHVLASFLSGTEPRMAGVCFGVEYDESSVAIDDWGYCGDFELHQTAWPSSGSGICVTWFEAQTAFLTEIGWLAAHSVDGSPAQLSLVNHPVGGGVFGDDEVPANIDDIAGYGNFGFYMDGSVPCADDPVPALDASWGDVKRRFH